LVCALTAIRKNKKPGMLKEIEKEVVRLHDTIQSNEEKVLGRGVEHG
jgi:hypothetical protein